MRDEIERQCSETPSFAFAIRDDDTSYFTDPQDLESAYAGIWETAPVSLAVVPFHGCTRTGGIAKKYWSGSGRRYPIGDNQELVAYLQDRLNQGWVSLMMHGYSHISGPNGHEFEIGEYLESKVFEAKRYLKGTFGTSIRAFVPPHNALSVAGYRAVINNGLDIVQIVPFRPKRRPFDVRYIRNLTRVAWARLVWGHAYPHVLDFGTHREVAFHPLTPSANFRRLLGELEFCYRRYGAFVLATHHWEFGEATEDCLNLRLALEKLLERASELNAQFCSVNQLFEGVPSEATHRG